MNPGDYEDPDVRRSPDYDAALGITVPAPRPIGVHDGRASKTERVDAISLGWIGEDSAGVWTKRNPHAALCERTHLWAPLAELRLSGCAPELDDPRHRSNLELEIRNTYRAATYRERQRRAKDGE